MCKPAPVETFSLHSPDVAGFIPVPVLVPMWKTTDGAAVSNLKPQSLKTLAAKVCAVMRRWGVLAHVDSGRCVWQPATHATVVLAYFMFCLVCSTTQQRTLQHMHDFHCILFLVPIQFRIVVRLRRAPTAPAHVTLAMQALTSEGPVLFYQGQLWPTLQTTWKWYHGICLDAALVAPGQVDC